MGRTVNLRSRQVPVLDLAAVAVIAVGCGLQARALQTAGPALAEVAQQAAVARRGLVAVLADPAALAVAGAPGAATGGIITRGIVWLVATFAPLNQFAVTLAAISLRVALAFGVWLLLRRLLSPSPLLLVPLAVVMTAPQLIPAGIGTTNLAGPLAATVALVWAAVAHVWWTDARRLRAVAVLTALALGCDRSGVLGPVVLLLLSATVAAAPSPAGTAGTTAGLHGLRSGWPPAAASAAVVAVVVVLPGLRPADLWLRADAATAGGVGDVLRAVAGGLLGAPWSWSPAELRGLPRPATGVVTAAVLLVGVALLLSARRDRPRTLRAVAFGTGWSVAALVVGVPGRPQGMAAVLGVTVAVVLAVALAALPARSQPSAIVPAGSASQFSASQFSASQFSALVLPAVVLLAGVPTATGFGRAAGVDPSARWVAAVRTALGPLPPFPRITSRLVPAPVAAADDVPGTLDTDLVTLLRPDALVHDADVEPLALDDQGRLGPARLDRLGGSARAPLCVAVVQPGEVQEARVRLTSPVALPPGSQVRLKVLITGTARLRVVVEGPDAGTTPVRRWSDDLLYEGPHTVLFPVGPTVRTAVAIRVRPVTPDAGVCVVGGELVRAR